MSLFAPSLEVLPEQSTSSFYKLNARAKLIGFFILLVACLQARNLASLGLCTGFLIIVLSLARIKMSALLIRMAPFLCIIAVSTMLNVFALSQESLSHLQSISSSVALPQSLYLIHSDLFIITYEGFFRALFIGARLTLITALMMTLTLASNLYDLIHALVSLLRPLELLGFPLPEFACIMGLALRFVPEFQSEFSRLNKAFKARMANSHRARSCPKSSGSAVKHSLFTWGFMPFVLPLAASLIRRSYTLSLAFDARCFRLMPLTLHTPRAFTAAESSFVLLCLSLALLVFALSLNNACTGLFCRLV